MGAWLAAGAMGAGPLAGVRVLDCTEIIAGPLSAMLLADMGADVIKIEPPEGEPWRLQGQYMPVESKNYQSLNRGKRGIALNLKTSEGQTIAQALAKDADVFITNYRPDVPDKLGLGYATLSALNPRLIYCVNTAFGSDGPHARRPGYDIILQAMSGLMAGAGTTTEQGVPTTVGGTAVADFSGAIMIAWAVCAALYERERSGKGQRIDTSLYGAAFAIQSSRIFSVEAREEELRRSLVDTVQVMRQEGRPYKDVVAAAVEARGMTGAQAANIYYRVYQTKDDFLAVGCLSQALRIKFCKAVGIEDPRLVGLRFDATSLEGREVGLRLAPVVEAIMRDKPIAEWLAILDAAGIPAGPVRFAEELFEDEHVLANDLVVDLEHSVAGPLKMIGAPVKMSRTPVRPRTASPALGQHNTEILSALGYDSAQIEALRKQGVIHE